MTALPKRIFDRRFYPRTLINGDIKINSDQFNTYDEGLMLNISQTGVLIGTNHKLNLQSQINLIMEPDQQGEAPIEIVAEVVRNAEKSDACDYTYGCLILTTSGV